ncbi:excinuclease ABC subunit UvrB [Tepidibacter hydrothermalis]|uniref:UvrABC system protein B n=1 Tax=Tepidibacter hydrothermalis TaxID=3036126 RepID=A0ABY8ECK7_9FIRM|nr:excinuclease ABC subunit UvrB [Tepidibacter hydrothermalis]WFD10672.1 excinuclease ABC subunit UvrB [Tepidibacter hydrothermalis]
MEFKIESKFKPTGDQPQAIEQIVNSINNNNKFTSLLGVTGSGKTFTMANVIEKVQKPTLIMAHNKTLAAQLYSEFKDFFPNNAVEYFVSYYNHYQPEAYVAHTDTYIEKDASVNDEIDKLRHSATAAILERKDVIIISSVSCIYGLGDPKDYKELMISLRPGMERDRDEVIKELVSIQYERNDINFERGTFRVRGDIIEIMPANSDDTGIRIEFFGDEIERITEINYITGEIIGTRNHIAIFPASHYATNPERLEKALINIEDELQDRVKYFKENEKLLEAQRIEQRTNYDIEMLKEIGFCQGIENYSRHITGRKEGEKPYTLMDFFPDDYLIIVDESHVTVPQVRGMYGGDRSRKESLIENGFRLPSAYDNRPLNFGEFEENINQMLFVSATPGPYEIQNSTEFTEQIIRPTGLLDPEIDVRPITNQIDNLLGEINDTVSKKERVLVTTLTKRMSEDLTDYLKNAGIKVKYLHSDIETLERTEIIRDLRIGKFDVLVGINLLREGLDIPEVSLVAILDADKEGFLRSETSLIQTVGRAARNKNGRVIMYADKITRSMESAINETNRRRELQQKYNEENNIIPQSINKEIKNVIEATQVADEEVAYGISKNIDKDELKENINRLKDEMMEAAKNLQFERAASLRDKIVELEERIEK